MGSAPDVGDILKQVRSCARRQIGAAQIESCLLPAAHLQSSPVWCCLSSSAPTCMLHHIAHKVAFVVTRTLSGSSSAALLQGQAVSLKLNWHQCFQHRRSCVWQVSSIVEGTCNPDLSLGYTEMLGEPLAHRADEVWIRTECNTTATEAFDTLCLSPLFSLRACLPFEDAGWSYIYREDVPDIEALSPLKRGLADWIAEEADLRMRHMRLVESFVAVTVDYLQKPPQAEHFAEVALIIFDMVSRIGGKSPARPRLGWRQAKITVGEPISVTQRWENSSGDRLSARQAVSDLTRDLQTALEELIQD